MPPTQVHHPNRPHQENATTLTHDYAKLQAKAKHDATQIQHSYLIRQYLRLLDVISHSHDVSSTSGLPRGLSSQGTATPSRGSSGTLCSVATGCAGWVKVSGGIAIWCYLWPTAPITRRNCNWKLILTRRTSQEWEILGKWLAYSIQHMSYGSIWLMCQ